MSDYELEPLAPDLATLLAKAKAKEIEPLDAGEKAAILAAAFTKLGLPPGGGGGAPDGGGGGHGGAPSAGHGEIAAHGQRVLSAVTRTKAAIALAGTFALGTAAGVAADRAALPRASSPVAVVTALRSATGPTNVESVANATNSNAASATSSPNADAIPASSLPDAPSPRASAPLRGEPSGPSAVPSARGLAAERALLDVARSALARGEAGAALAAADRHARDYPDGALVEEREAIAIRALVALGRKDQAKKRARDFERRFPNGLMLRAVRAAVADEPLE